MGFYDALKKVLGLKSNVGIGVDDFTADKDLFIPSGEEAAFKTLTINSGVTVRVDGFLTVKGKIANSGTLINNGEIESGW